jgi:hypothetical protein
MIGFSRTLKFFNPWKKGTEKLKGIICFFCGILLVLFGWPMIGILVEAYVAFVLSYHTHTHTQTKNRYGIFKLFGSFFPIMIKSIQGFISSLFGTESSLLRKMGGIKESGV